MKSLHNWMLVIVTFFLLTACSTREEFYDIDFTNFEEHVAPEENAAKTPIRLAISNVLSPADTITYYREIANYIGKKLHRPAILIQRRSYNEISNLLINGGADIALLSSGAYVTHIDKQKYEGIATQQRFGSQFYYGYVVVRQSSDFKALKDLKEHNIAFYDPSSYSGYLFLKEELEKDGQDVKTYFQRQTFTYDQEGALRAVVNGLVDAAAVNSLAYEKMMHENPTYKDALKIIEQSMPLGTGPVVVRSSLDSATKKVIQQSFLTMHVEKKMGVSLRGLYIDRFIPFNDTYYEVSYEMD